VVLSYVERGAQTETAMIFLARGEGHGRGFPGLIIHASTVIGECDRDATLTLHGLNAHNTRLTRVRELFDDVGDNALKSCRYLIRRPVHQRYLRQVTPILSMSTDFY
jgi:hypothetical protein